jgi:hypothetical protein
MTSKREPASCFGMVVKVTKVNMMSGKEFEQPINTPLCCDPSSETYWSM